MAFAEVDETRSWAIQYICLAIIAMALGACLVTRRNHGDVNPFSSSNGPIQCPSLYLAAGLVPLFLNIVLYYTSLRGLDYVEIHKAGLGPEKYILFLVVVTHAAFMRMFASWKFLPRRSRLMLLALVCIFLFVYVFLMPLRTNLFIFGMYAIYFLGGSITWRTKIAFIAIGIVLFAWMAMYRAGTEDKRTEIGIAAGTIDALSFGLGMVDMVPWANDEMRIHGPSWGSSYFLEVVSTKYSPGVRYVQEKAPAYAESGGGYGFFYIAELLLNFGYLGGLLAASIFGMILQGLSVTWSPIVRSTVLPALLAASFPLIRNDFMTTLKIPVYLVISCLILDRTARFIVRFGELIRLSNLSSV